MLVSRSLPTWHCIGITSRHEDEEVGVAMVMSHKSLRSHQHHIQVIEVTLASLSCPSRLVCHRRLSASVHCRQMGGEGEGGIVLFILSSSWPFPCTLIIITCPLCPCCPSPTSLSTLLSAGHLSCRGIVVVWWGHCHCHLSAFTCCRQMGGQGEGEGIILFISSSSWPSSCTLIVIIRPPCPRCPSPTSLPLSVGHLSCKGVIVIWWGHHHCCPFMSMCCRQWEGREREGELLLSSCHCHGRPPTPLSWSGGGTVIINLHRCIVGKSEGRVRVLLRHCGHALHPHHVCRLVGASPSPSICICML